jgi:hypothetical protein
MASSFGYLDNPKDRVFDKIHKIKIVFFDANLQLPVPLACDR